MASIVKEIKSYNNARPAGYKTVCNTLAKEISSHLPEAENKIWHAHPVWFIDGNPIVGYSEQKAGIRLMFWSGVGFDEPGLTPGTGKYKDASAFYQTKKDINTDDLKRWLEKSSVIQWDYKNIVKRRGKLVRVRPVKLG